MSDPVVPEMASRLEVNRTGKMTPGQWIDVIMQPLITLIVFIAPLSVFFLPLMLRFIVRGGIFVIIAVLAVMMIAFLLRAAHYARQPVHFEVLEAKVGTPAFWAFWRPIILFDEAGNRIKFSKRLAPRPILRHGKTYLVYYLKESDHNVLLSIAPADHKRAEAWQPTQLFESRFKQRSQR